MSIVNTRPSLKSGTYTGAAHTDIMQISEQVFDEALFWRHSGQQGQRVKSRSDDNSLLDLPRS